MTTAHFLPKNVDKGVVIGGMRHPHCIHAMNAITGTVQYQQGEQVQGFLTNMDRFVDRKEGLEIAIKANQLIGPPRGQLYSEELY